MTVKLPKPGKEKPPYISINGASKQTGLTPRVIQTLLKNGLLSYITMDSGRHLVLASDIDDLVRSRPRR
jgi:hypothetical protein